MDAAISIENLSKRLSGRQVLRDMSFSVEAGDIFGCLGPNGAGKTTTILAALCYVLSLRLTKERVVLSSKG